MTEKEIEILNDSFMRCMQGDVFFDVFYDHFIASSPQVAQKFQYTDFIKQKREVKSSFYLAMEAIAQKKSNLSVLNEIAQRHSAKELDITPVLYTLWLESMIYAVRQCDNQFNATVEKTWRRAMQQVIDYMVARY